MNVRARVTGGRGRCTDRRTTTSRRRHRTVLPVLVAALVTAAVVGIAGCGGEDGESAAPDGSAEIVAIAMGDYFFDPQDATAPSGALTLQAQNNGTVEHELEILSTDADPSALPVSGDEVDTEALEANGARELGELEAEPGESQSIAVDLAPGRYVMICNLPGHYRQGMWGTITIG